jgi:hypothetical protein
MAEAYGGGVVITTACLTGILIGLLIGILIGGTVATVVVCALTYGHPGSK